MKSYVAFFIVFLLSIGLVAGLLSSLPREARAQSSGIVRRLSVGLYGEEADGGSSSPAFSANGRFVAFASAATNLVPGDTNGKDDIFIYDRATGALGRVSLADDGSEATGGHSYAPAISADGRYVAFHSYATNLVISDTNDHADVFVRDREEGRTVRVSVASDGSQAQYGGSDPAISADGRFVAFWSCSTDLVISDTNGYCDIFVRDRDSDEDGIFDEEGAVKTVRVSVAGDGSQANGDSGAPDISADGRFVVFESLASNLVAGDTNDEYDVFLHDRDADEDGIFDEEEAGAISTIRISVATNGTEGDGFSGRASISADGRYVAFESSATNLVPDDTNNYSDIFLREWRGDGTTTRVSVSSGGSEGDGFSEAPAISFDGRFVAFVSNAYDLDSTCNYAARHVLVRDLETHRTQCVSLSADGTEAYGDSWNPVMSADGHYVAFGSDADNLVSGDDNGVRDIFVRDRQVSSPVANTISASGGMLAASDILLDFPAHTFTGTVVVTCTARSSASTLAASAGDGGLVGVGRFFDIEAVYQATGEPAQPASGKSYTVSISYSDEEKSPAIEDTLAVYYQTGGQWAKEASSAVDTADNTVTASPNHLSLFAVLGETRRVYLPLVLRGY